MKQQILWKRIDFIGQLVMLVLPQCYPYHDYEGGQHFFAGLFIALFTVGGWQVISALVHAVSFPKAYWHGGRKAYNITLVSIFSLAILLTITRSEAASIGLMAMLVIGPVMAFWYFAACIAEVNYLKTVKDKMQIGAFTDFPSL